jgi:hypothetical protein
MKEKRVTKDEKPTSTVKSTQKIERNKVCFDFIKLYLDMTDQMMWLRPTSAMITTVGRELDQKVRRHQTKKHSNSSRVNYNK